MIILDLARVIMSLEIRLCGDDLWAKIRYRSPEDVASFVGTMSSWTNEYDIIYLNL